MPEITIRLEQPSDYNDILSLTYDAFLTLDYPGRQRTDEHYLIHLLRGSAFVIRELCFVAELDGKIVGHILYTKSKIIYSNGSETDTVTFGPLSVAPEYQNQGIGASLIRRSMDKAQSLGFGAVLIVGVPEYYPKFGFKRASEYSLTLPDGSTPDAFMAYELVPNYLNGGGVLQFLPPEFEQCETDAKGFEAFHKQFAEAHLQRKMTPKQTLVRFVELFNKADAKSLSELYTENAVNHQVANEPVIGKNAIYDMFVKEFKAAEMVCLVENMFEDGEWAIMEWKDPKGLRGCGFFHVVYGKIVFQRGYWDKLSFMKQEGV